MYKKLKTYIPDIRDPEVQKKELIEYFQKEVFDNHKVYAISKAMQDKGVTVEKYAIYRQCAELNVADIKRTLENKAGTFKNDYSIMVYILAILNKHIVDDIKPAEPKSESKEVLGQSNPMPAPPPPTETKCSGWIDELMADSQPPKQGSEENNPSINETDLFESELDTVHAWAKLDESERRKNWEKAIAEHKQPHPSRGYSYDEMY